MPEVNISTLPPTLFLTIKGNSASEKVIKKLKERTGEGNVLCVVCENENEAHERVHTHTSQRSVALFDNKDPNRRKHFTMRVSVNEHHKKCFPSWARDENILWGVEITTKKCDETRCAHQLRGIFIKQFLYDPVHEKLPWGKKRKEMNQKRKRKRYRKNFLEHFNSC